MTDVVLAADTVFHIGTIGTWRKGTQGTLAGAWREASFSFSPGHKLTYRGTILFHTDGYLLGLMHPSLGSL